MNTKINEDYCDFETAKLLKEKGFNALTCGFYYDNYTEKLIVSSPSNHNGSINTISAPSLGHAMKWLRELHGHIINVWYEGKSWLSEYFFNKEFTLIGDNYTNYEEACEAAIKYCLTNLI